MSESSQRQSRLSALRRLSDEELGAEASVGDERAARVLLERYEESVYRYSLALVRDPNVARDVAGSVLLEAHRALRAGEQSEPVAPWLFKIASSSAYLATDRAERDRAAEIAADAGGESRPRLQGLLDGLDKLGALELSALLLREIARLDYVGIATAARSRPPVARQAVFRARLALQGDVEAPSEHCDEIRAAMSKAEIGFRERRSIASHLETCPVCEEFAEQLEQRPEDLRTLFPPTSGSLAAELLPSMAGAAAVGAGAAAAGAAAGTVAAEAAGAGAGGAAKPPKRRQPRGARESGGRGRRPMLIPAILGLLLLGAAIATALALQHAGHGKRSAADAAPATVGQAPGAKGKAAAPSKPKTKKAAPKPKPKPKPKAAAPAVKPKPKAKPNPPRKHRAAPVPSTGSGQAAPKSRGHTQPTPAPQGGSSPGQAKSKPCPRPAASPARSAYSGRSGAVQAELRPCVHASGGGGGGLAATGLELSLLVASGLSLLGLGFGLRRLSRPR